MTAKDLVDESAFDRADEFLDALMPRLGWRPQHREDQWIYRGHSKTEIQLIPSALRDYESWAPPLEYSQRSADHQRLLLFERQLNRQALPLPRGSREVMAAALYSEESVRFDEWSRADPYPADRDLPMMALAQHYGIPTRLLDWSTNPLIATFFAASEAFDVYERDFPQEGLGDRRLAVWMMDTSITYGQLPLEHLAAFNPAYEGNPHLAAQAGVFTIWRPTGSDWNDRVDCRPLDQLLADEPAIDAVDEPPLRKLTLPISETPPLLRQLRRWGVDRSTVRPGFAGAAQAAHEHDRVDRHVSWARGLEETDGTDGRT